MTKSFINATEVRDFFVNHIFYPSSATDSQYVFNSGYFAKLKGDADQYETQAKLSDGSFDLKLPYAIVKQRDRYLLIDGSKAINGLDYAFQIEVVGDGKAIPGNEEKDEYARYSLKLTSEISHQAMVSVSPRVNSLRLKQGFLLSNKPPHLLLHRWPHNSNDIHPRQ